MGGKVMQSHLTKTGRECDLRENTRRTFLTMLGQQSRQSIKEYVVRRAACEQARQATAWGPEPPGGPPTADKLNDSAVTAAPSGQVETTLSTTS
jgi:hypothetical protein